jgi:hypothetical protein
MRQRDTINPRGEPRALASTKATRAADAWPLIDASVLGVQSGSVARTLDRCDLTQRQRSRGSACSVSTPGQRGAPQRSCRRCVGGIHDRSSDTAANTKILTTNPIILPHTRPTPPTLLLFRSETPSFPFYTPDQTTLHCNTRAYTESPLPNHQRPSTHLADRNIQSS